MYLHWENKFKMLKNLFSNFPLNPSLMLTCFARLNVEQKMKSKEGKKIKIIKKRENILMMFVTLWWHTHTTVKMQWKIQSTIMEKVQKYVSDF